MIGKLFLQERRNAMLHILSRNMREKAILWIKKRLLSSEQPLFLFMSLMLASSYLGLTDQ